MSLGRRESGTPPEPPPGIFSLVHYTSPVGSLAAYVSPPGADHQRRPAIVWIPGGFDESIDESQWAHQPPRNDQTARAFREAGVVLMIPSLRGGNDNPGTRELAYGEVDDVIAAGNYLAHLDYVDPSRIYLGGHSTGGTLVLLVAESTDQFRAVFAFGPVPDFGGYGRGILGGVSDPREFRLRSPRHFISAIRTPTFIFEGAVQPCNAAGLPFLTPTDDAPVHVHRVEGVTHFSILSPVTTLLARKIRDARGDIDITDAELQAAVAAD